MRRRFQLTVLFCPTSNIARQIGWFLVPPHSEKIVNLNKRALRFLLNDYVRSFEQLLQKSSKTSINLRNHRVLCTEVFKTMIDLNPTYMKEIFERSVSNKIPVRQNCKMNLVTPKTNQVRYRTKSFRSLAPKSQNLLLVSIKSSGNLESFKQFIQFCDGTSCKLMR